MKNKKYYPFERSNYFFGKLLTVRDFENEQRYNNDKRRLGNRLLHGAGIVTGLDVVKIDEQTLSVEVGFAIDYLGREVLVAEPSIRRLASIQGFDEVKEKSEIYLCLAYQEEFKEAAFSVTDVVEKGVKNDEYNRIEEGYQLFLTDKKPAFEDISLDSLITNRVVLFQKDGVSLCASYPKYCKLNQTAQLQITLEKSNVAAPVEFELSVESAFFKPEKGGTIRYQETEITTNKTEQIEILLCCTAQTDAFTELKIPKDCFKLKIGEEVCALEEDGVLSLRVVSTDVRELVIESYYAKHFNEIVTAKEDNYLYLAAIKLFSNKNSYFIDQCSSHPFKQYILSAQLLSVLDKVQMQPALQIVEQATQAAALPEVVYQSNDHIACGIETIIIGSGAKKGDVFYSDEFIHELGSGEVFMVLSLECLNRKGDVFEVGGANGLFNSIIGMDDVAQVQSGYMINKQKGTAKIGIKLLDRCTQTSIKIRWYAYKMLKDNFTGEYLDSNVIKVAVYPNSVTVVPRGTARFSAQIEGSDSQEVRWSVSETAGGQIDENGYYVAPSKAGVYEIVAESIRFSGNKSSAFVIVEADAE